MVRIVLRDAAPLTFNLGGSTDYKTLDQVNDTSFSIKEERMKESQRQIKYPDLYHCYSGGLRASERR